MRNDAILRTSHRPVLSQTAEHALRAALFLGGKPSGELVPADRIAAALGTPPNYTGKTLRRLAQKGLLRSVRGPRGGFQLCVPLESLTLARLMDAVDEHADAPSTCLLGDRPCDPDHPCQAHDRWAGLENRISRLMEETSVADLLGVRSEGVPDIQPTSPSQNEVSTS